MLFTLTNTAAPATDLGYLLHKNPNRCQVADLNFGKAYIFYPEASEKSCTAALLLDIDPVAIVRGKPGTTGGGPLAQYVNDKPYVASSFLSVAIASLYGSALQGKCPQRPDLAATRLPLTAELAVLPCRGGRNFLSELFEPLGYDLQATRHALDQRFPNWGDSVYYTVTLSKRTTVQELLAHLYVLIPVLDNDKHYYVGESEVENLLSKGAQWLAGHPLRDTIVKRYLKFRFSLARQALARLTEEEPEDTDADSCQPDGQELTLEETVSLNEERLGAVLAALRESGAGSVLDIGCGEGKLLRLLLKEKAITGIVGMDVSVRSLEIAHQKLGLDRLAGPARERIRLIHGSLLYRDSRFSGFDAATVMEVIEHLDPPRLTAFERVLFEAARPGRIILTTPNHEYNAMWPNLPAGRFRHPDHRFEWTRREFQEWAQATADRYGYSVRFVPVGREDEILGAPTQMGVFINGN